MRKKIIIAIIIFMSIVSLAIGIFLIENGAPNQPSVPTDFTTTVISSTRIDLTWTNGKNVDTTYIERNSMSSWRRGEGILIYNDTKVSYQDIGLSQNSHYYYQAWSWNQTDHVFSTTFATDDNTTFVNLPPIFALPNPVNGSTNNPFSFTWNIQITDPEGDVFSWTIHCSNGQTNSGTGAANGTKSLSLSGLTNLTSYKIWVNATDPTGSGLYTRRWYTFTTKTNLGDTPPVFGTPSPANGSTGNLLSPTWSIPINDPQGDIFTWTIQCSNGQTNSGTGASNGTKSLALSGLANSTNYKVWVNATDPTGSGLWTRRWYTFTTEKLDQQQTQMKNNFALYTIRWGGQSFIPTVKTLTRVEVYMRKAGSPPSDIVLSIRSALTGDDLVSISKPASQIPTTSSWVEFDFSNILITPGSTYYLVLKTSGGNFMNFYYWGYGSGTPYTNGMRWSSFIGGIIWTQFPKFDFCIKIYGFT